MGGLGEHSDNMKISTSQLKSLMGAKPSVIAVKSLCDCAGVNYDNIRMRLKRGGSLTPDEEEALGEALADYICYHLGWVVER